MKHVKGKFMSLIMRPYSASGNISLREGNVLHKQSQESNAYHLWH